VTARSGADEPKDPARRRPADLIEPTVPQQERRIATQHREPPEQRQAQSAWKPSESHEPAEVLEHPEHTGSPDICAPAEHHAAPAAEHHAAPADGERAERHESPEVCRPPDHRTSRGHSEPQGSREALLGRDPLEHPDPRAAADAAALENLLRCWVRETVPARPQNGVSFTD